MGKTANRFGTAMLLCLTLLIPGLARADKVVVVVNSDLAPLVQQELDGYKADMAIEGFEVIQRNWNLSAPAENTPASLKSYLAGVSGLNGAVFIGNQRTELL